jgi:hypothetical protein
VAASYQINHNQETMKYLLYLSFLIGMGGCRCYTSFEFKGDTATILSTHHRSPQPYCQKVFVCLNEKHQWYGYQYCIISPCCTGIYFDTTGLYAQEVAYNKTHKR